MTRELLLFLREEAQRPDARLEESLHVAIERIFDFFVTNPTFIRLTEWEALNGGRYLGSLPTLITTLREAVQVLSEEVGWHNDVEQFLIDPPGDGYTTPLVPNPDYNRIYTLDSSDQSLLAFMDTP